MRSGVFGDNARFANPPSIKELSRRGRAIKLTAARFVKYRADARRDEVTVPQSSAMTEVTVPTSLRADQGTVLFVSFVKKEM